MKQRIIMANCKCATFPTYFLLMIYCLLCIQSYAQTNINKPKQLAKQRNTTIIINFKKVSDKHFTSFGQLNPLHLEPSIISPPAHQLDTIERLKTTITLTLIEPNYLALGFNIFYIEPGDSVNIDFQTLLNTKTQYKDTVTVNAGNVFFIARNGEPTARAKDFMSDFVGKLSKITLPRDMLAYLDNSNIKQAVTEYTALTYADQPHLKHAGFPLTKATAIIDKRFHWSLLHRLKYFYKNTNDEFLKKSIIEGVTKILENACQEPSELSDALTLGKYLGIYHFFIDVGFTGKEIQDKFTLCNDTTKQYVLLNLLKDGQLPSGITKETILSQLTYPVFADFAKKVYQHANRGIEKTGYVNNLIRNTEIFDTNDRRMLFGDLFKSTQQRYLIIDFCGSWCAPCIDELALYQRNKNLDQSKQVRPIWLFFENDKSKWLPLVKKFGLKPENCFVILGNNTQLISKEFAVLFDWQGEFPHHFVFSKEGEIIDKNAPSLSSFVEKHLPVATGPNMMSLPPALPKKN